VTKGNDSGVLRIPFPVQGLGFRDVGVTNSNDSAVSESLNAI
jgi:hypothetical protein